MTTDIPGGTVTFLFTDIEGSTQLWEQNPEAMKLALARHDAILRETIETHDGYVFKTVGDSFYSTFANASHALLAAINAQEILRAENWGATPIRVRMALHTGTANERDSDYFGPSLNRAARLLAAGHGGQILLSLTTQELVRDNLPCKTSLSELGEYRLKDLFRPETVFQLNNPGAPSQFPPLRTLDVKHTNLPGQPTQFIGRERELKAVLNLLRRADVRLLTLTGPGGTGKTRLSLQMAADLLDEYKQGVYFVPLATITDPELVIPSIAAIFNLKETGSRSIDAMLKDYLAEKHLLLVLDNLEQVLSAAPKIAGLLTDAPDLKIIASSRERLHIYSEHEYAVLPLTLPDMQKKPSITALSQYEAVALFIQRAKAVNLNFEINEQNAPAVAEICFRLDGLPLAIELAAARSKMLNPQAILERLSNRLKTLTGGARDLPARQQTIRGAIDWSYNLLDDGEKMLFARLGIFTGGWTFEAAEAICTENLPIELFDGLESLTDKSLIRQVTGTDGEARFIILETIREYALEKLNTAGESENIQDRHLQYFMELSQQAGPQLLGPQVAQWRKRLNAELDNLRTALEWSLKRDAPKGLVLITAIQAYWIGIGYVQNTSDYLSQLLNQPKAQTHTVLRVRALQLFGVLSFNAVAHRARMIFEETLALSRELDDQPGIAISLIWLGDRVFQESDLERGRAMVLEGLAHCRALNHKIGIISALERLGGDIDNLDHQRAKAYLEEALALCREMGYLSRMPNLLNHLGRLAFRYQENTVARAYFEEAQALLHQLGQETEFNLLLNLGELALADGDYTCAQTLVEQSITIIKNQGWGDSNWPCAKLGYIMLRQGDMKKARKLFQDSQQGFKELDSIIGVIYTVEGLTSLAVMQGQPEAAARLFAWADATRQHIDNPRPPVEQADVNRDIATIRTKIDEASFAAAQALGRTMSMDEAISYAIQVTDEQ